ncbi:hypothetical protein GJ699_33940, partial [Duganella sp. FT80W]
MPPGGQDAAGADRFTPLGKGSGANGNNACDTDTGTSVDSSLADGLIGLPSADTITPAIRRACAAAFTSPGTPACASCIDGNGAGLLRSRAAGPAAAATAAAAPLAAPPAPAACVVAA